MGKFDNFTEDELYILKRQAIESSYTIMCEDKYNEHEKAVHNSLLNEIIDALKYRTMKT